MWDGRTLSTIGRRPRAVLCLLVQGGFFASPIAESCVDEPRGTPKSLHCVSASASLCFLCVSLTTRVWVVAMDRNATVRIDGDGDDLSKAPPSGSEDAAMLDQWQPSTRAVHADDPLNVVADVAPPIHVSTTFRYTNDPDQLVPYHERPEPKMARGEHIYSRDTTHSTTRLEAILASLLHNPCVAYSSGLASFHALLLLLCPKRVAIGAGYHGCHHVLEVYQRASGCRLLALDCPAEVLQKGDLVHLETPVNPTGNALSIQHYAAVAHSRGAYLSVDATFGPPPLQDPFKWGADVVMHSGTKYIGGHSDILCGVLAVKNHDWVRQLREDRVALGSVMGGLEGWLGVRSVRTLELRVMRQSENAQVLVDALQGALTGHTVGTGLSKSDVEATRAVVKELKHASLQMSDKAWLTKQMPHGYGPVFAIVTHSPDLARKLPSKLHLFHHATSLGGVESLIEWRVMSDSTTARDLLRVSVGIENAQDLLNDLLQGFRALIGEGPK